MDYVVGSVAALLTGNVTPNRPKLNKRALTPTKSRPSPNVTPKSELVDDRSIFMSPTLQKKKAIVKKSPKRIFQNPDLEVTNAGETNSPKADKVKKHLKEDLEAGDSSKNADTSLKSPKKGKRKLNKSVELSAEKKSDVEVTSQVKKAEDKQRKSLVEATANGSDDKENVEKSQSEMKVLSPKKRKLTSDNTETLTVEPAASGSPKKRRKYKKKKQTAVQFEQKQNLKEDEEVKPESKTQTKSKKKQNKQNKNKNKQVQNQIETKMEINDNAANENDFSNEVTENNLDSENDSNTENASEVSALKSKTKNKKRKNKNKTNKNSTENRQESIEMEMNEKAAKNAHIVNPNAITDMDTDSEHESDNEIESDNEDTGEEVSEPPADSEESSNEQENEKTKQKEKVKKKETDEVDLEAEVKRTLFVGNVPFSKKIRKDVKKIFKKYGDIETIRIRTVPVKDARVTPKLAVIKNELHPDRSTVNMYIKFKEESSVDQALSENNTVYNDHHLRVTRSDSCGRLHDPRCSVFLGNLPFGVDDETLRAKFEKCGEIESVRVVRDKKTNAGKGFGYINFASKDGVELALALPEEDLTIKNRIIRVKRCTQLTQKQEQALKERKGKNQKFQPRNQGSDDRKQGFQRTDNFRGRDQSFRGRPQRFQGRNRGFEGRNRGVEGRNQGFQGRNEGFQSRNEGFQGRNQRGRGGFRGGRGQGMRQRGFGRPEQSDEKTDWAYRRIMNKRQNQESGDGPPDKRPKNAAEPTREKKAKKEFVGMTAEKKKKKKFDKGLKKKKALSEIMSM